MRGRVLIALLWIVGAIVPICATHAADLVFAVTEGVTYQATPKEIREKFAPLADVIAKSSRQSVRMVLVPAYDDLRAGMAKQEYDVVFVHPAHLPFAEIKAGRYKAIAWTSGFTDYTVSLLLKPSTPLKSMNDLKGRTLVTPDPDSITAWMVRAMFRADNLAPNDVKVITTRYQDAVPYYVEHEFAQVGATAARAVVKSWTDKGGKVLLNSRPVPIKQIIVSTKLPAEEQERIRAAIIGLTLTKEGRDALAVVGYKGFVAPNPEIESASIAWLGL